MNHKTKLPLNIADKYISLFKKKEYYKLPSLRVKVLKRVFVNHWGIVLKRFVIPFKSAENLIGSYDQTFYWIHWKKVIEQFLVCKFGKSLPFIKLDAKEEYFTIHTPWFGYFSWLTTYVPKLLSVIENHPHAILLVPEEWNKIMYVRDTLDMFPNLKMKVLPNDHHVFVEKFIFAENRPWTSIFYPEQIHQVRGVFFSQIAGVKLKPVARLYVSRRKANRRKIVNELELLDYLKSQGFEEICFEDYSIAEQVFLMKNAEYLVSMHGAGLTNVMFMNPFTSVLEITPIVEKENQFRFPFWRISSILDVNYYVQFSTTVNNGEIDLYSRNIEVDIPELKMNIELMLNIKA
jgi:hypothetical protein